MRNALVVAVLLLLVAEALTRAIEPRLPPDSGWPNEEVAHKWDQIEDLAEGGGVGLAVFGSSVADVGIDPEAIPFEVSGPKGSYNAGLLSAVMTVSATWAQHVVVPELHPSIAVIGVAAGDVRQVDPEHDDWFFDAPQIRRLLRKESVADKAEGWLNSRSALLRHRSQIRDLRVLLDVMKGRSLALVNRYGMNIEQLDRPYAVGHQALEGLRAELVDFRTDSGQLAALGQMVRELEDAGCRVLVFLAPYSADYVASFPRGQADIDGATEAVLEVVRDSAAEVLAFGQWDDSLMTDISHVNRAGAARLTAAIVDQLRRDAPARR